MLTLYNTITKDKVVQSVVHKLLLLFTPDYIDAVWHFFGCCLTCVLISCSQDRTISPAFGVQQEADWTAFKAETSIL